jgi:Fic family protein
MSPAAPALNLASSVLYHYGKFPPSNLDYSRLIGPANAAAAALGRYDQMLQSLPNSSLLLAPLSRREAIISSRMEGTVSTLDELLKFEAAQEEEGDAAAARHRSETFEVFLYERALRRAQRAIEEGRPISEHLICSAHELLLAHGRGANKAPGRYKDDQNYIVGADKTKVLFTPIDPLQLKPSMERLLDYINSADGDILVRTAVAHVEFESLHPFRDGNGRIGRMLITLMLWRGRLISAPHFYVSAYFEDHKDEYIDAMRQVSASDAWTEWCLFFLGALRIQAENNLAIALEIMKLYDDMKATFREALSSQWHIKALDFVFERPIFRNNIFRQKSGIPSETAGRISRLLAERGLLTTLSPAAGRRPATYAFEPLLRLLRV